MKLLARNGMRSAGRPPPHSLSPHNSLVLAKALSAHPDADLAGRDALFEHLEGTAPRFGTFVHTNASAATPTTNVNNDPAMPISLTSDGSRTDGASRVCRAPRSDSRPLGRMRRWAIEPQQTSNVKLAMLAYVRDCLRVSEGEYFRIPTAALDEVLDELNSVERSLWGPR
ncbi:hypothetical protein [Rhodococcus jostii]|uniref:hypothetical protein n=1 Tax=Rhodococcus jostii TaxID=132919 RepID=UPI003657B37A